MFFFLMDFIFHSKIEGKVQRFPIPSLPTRVHNLFHYVHNIPQQSGMFVIIDELALTYYYFPSS